MSAPRHPATRSSPCRVCGAFGQGDDLVHASRYDATWRRGWVCRSHVEDLGGSEDVRRLAASLRRGVPLR